jgi:phosphinothricin acetyltransferase
MSDFLQKRIGDDGNGTAFTIRLARAIDAVAIADIYNEAIASTTATFDTEPKSEEERLRWLDSHDNRHPVFVAESDGRVIGWAALTKWSDRPAYARTVESSFYVGRQFRGRGIGRALKVRLIEEARRLGFHTILALVAEGSDASIHLNKSVGFTHIGTMKEVGLKFGQRLDVHVMQLMLDQPAEPEKVGSTIAAAGGTDFTLVESLTDEQIEQLHALCQKQWWCQGRSLEDVVLMVENTSLVLGLIENSSQRLIGFCRVLTDCAFRATIYDVMVAEEWQGRGLGRQLMDALLQHPKLQKVSAILLRCKPKMIPFYQRWGFIVTEEESQWMIKRQREG